MKFEWDENRYTAEELKSMQSQTDWERVRAMKDEDIDYSDLPDVTELLATGKARIIGRPKKADPKQSVHIRFSPDVLTRLRQMGRGWQTKVDQVMREWLDKAGTL